MDIIEAEFLEKAVQRGGILFFTPQDAISVVKRCKDLNRRILGIDAFIVTEAMTQPVISESIDCSKQTIDTWEKAMNFLSEHINSEFFFEVVYE